MQFLYKPRRANGQPVKLPILLAIFRQFNPFYWPLEDGLPMWVLYIYRVCWLFSFGIWQFHNEAEVHYLLENAGNIDALLTGVPTYIVLVESMLRVFYVSLSKEQLKLLMKRFYAHIYVDKLEHGTSHRHIEWSMWPTKLYACLYLSTLVTFVGIPVYLASLNLKMPLYRMSFHFDYTPNYIYIPLTLASVYVGIIVTTALFGDGYLFAELTLHLNERYLMLGRDLKASLNTILQHADPETIAQQFRLEVISIIQRNVALHQFAKEMQKVFTLQLFVLFSVSAALLCAIGFKVFTNATESFGYVFWVSAKILEMLAIGQVGTTILHTTNALSGMYYECGWEQIILHSSNAKQNVRLMELILIAMEINHKPVFFTGFNFFSVSLEAVLTILQAAGSYFTCLIAVH